MKEFAVILEKKPAPTASLIDYKFYCFNGEPKFCQVIVDRWKRETIDFYDMDWQHQPFTGLGLPRKPHSDRNIPAPSTFSEMKCAAKQLSAGILFVRVDFYDVNGKMYFGELTFYPASGFGVFEPDEWNTLLGDMLILAQEQRNE